jgi:hypothetical protein
MVGGRDETKEGKLFTHNTFGHSIITGRRPQEMRGASGGPAKADGRYKMSVWQ